MDSRTGELFGPGLSPEFMAALKKQNPDVVEVVGTPEQVARISAAVKAAHKRRRKAQKKARRLNR